MIGFTKLGKCRGCGQEIAFIKTVKGKTMPVNPESVNFTEGGGPNTYVMPDGSVKRGRGTEYGDEGETLIGYISHFATCPDADRFRRGRA